MRDVWGFSDHLHDTLRIRLGEAGYAVVDCIPGGAAVSLPPHAVPGAARALYEAAGLEPVTLTALDLTDIQARLHDAADAYEAEAAGGRAAAIPERRAVLMAAACRYRATAARLAGVRPGEHIGVIPDGTEGEQHG